MRCSSAGSDIVSAKLEHNAGNQLMCLTIYVLIHACKPHLIYNFFSSIKTFYIPYFNVHNFQTGRHASNNSLLKLKTFIL